MTTVKQYVTQMRGIQRNIAIQYGSDVSQLDKQTRVLNLSVLALLAVVIKTLTDNAVITDAQLQAVLNAAETWLLLRASGTEPLMRIYSESCSKESVQKLLESARAFALSS